MQESSRVVEILHYDFARERSSYEEHRVNAQAPGAEEGRGNLRKAMVSRKQALTHGYPNGGTHLG
jgi:hypothetical protein